MACGGGPHIIAKLGTHVASELPTHARWPVQTTTLMPGTTATTTATSIATAAATCPHPCLRRRFILNLNLMLAIKVSSRIKVQYSRPLSETLLALAAIDQKVQLVGGVDWGWRGVGWISGARSCEHCRACMTSQ